MAFKNQLYELKPMLTIQVQEDQIAVYQVPNKIPYKKAISNSALYLADSLETKCRRFCLMHHSCSIPQDSAKTSAEERTGGGHWPLKALGKTR